MLRLPSILFLTPIFVPSDGVFSAPE